MAESTFPGFADRLNELFRTFPQPGKGIPYTNEMVSETLTERGIPVSTQYISQLRSGRKANPSARLVGGLAAFFGVSVAYFFDEEEITPQQLEELGVMSVLRDNRLRHMLGRSQGLSPEGLQDVLRILDMVRRYEGLDDGDEARGARGAEH